MQYVHLECLNMWRASSANPQSSHLRRIMLSFSSQLSPFRFRCDQCKFEYSIQRTLYANILRSAIVLHSVTFLVFGAVVVLCGNICYCVDWLSHGSRDVQAARIVSI